MSPVQQLSWADQTDLVPDGLPEVPRFPENPITPAMPQATPSPLITWCRRLIADAGPTGHTVVDKTQLILLDSLIQLEISRSRSDEFFRSFALKKFEAIESLLLKLTTNAPPPPPPSQPPPRSWAEIAASNSSLPKKPATKPPPNKILNEFKLSSAIIRRPADSHPFADTPPSVICTKINAALLSINAKNGEKPLQVVSATPLPSGDLKVMTADRPSARWILDNKHLWTHLADPNFISKPLCFPVLLHGCPRSFDPDSSMCVQNLCEASRLPRDALDSVRWLIPPTGAKTHGSLLIHFIDRNLARKIESAGLLFDHHHLRGATFLKSPPQCFRCLHMGHVASRCSNPPFCMFCGQNHESNICTDATMSDEDNPVCQVCFCSAGANEGELSILDDRFAHSPRSSSCPVKKAWLDKFIKPSSSHFPILQLNCHNRFESTWAILNSAHVAKVIILQEPWINPISLHPPSHKEWHTLLGPTHAPACYLEKHRTCICFDVVSVYNPPKTYEGLPILEHWLNSCYRRGTPTLIGMDANLHHKRWNPPGYKYSNPQALTLNRLCGNKNLTIISPCHIPTFKSRGSATAIDLVWGNSAIKPYVVTSLILDDSFNSDHQALLTTLTLDNQTPPPLLLTPSLQYLDKTKYLSELSKVLATQPSCSLGSPTEIDESVKKLSDAVQQALLPQCRSVNPNKLKSKPWWEPDILNPLKKTRNQARKWLLLSNSHEALLSYRHHQQIFKEKVFELKRNHWRIFLAKATNASTFAALTYTKGAATNSILPIRRPNGSFASHKTEQADLLFKGTSVVSRSSPLSPGPTSFPLLSPPFSFPPITLQELTRHVKALPNKKATGPDKISNELIKDGLPTLGNWLLTIFNSMLALGHFPIKWRTATTAIIRKHGKGDYTQASAYRPIALLNSVGKLFERILNLRLQSWQLNHCPLPAAHFGGCKGRSIEDAFVCFVSWVHRKWQEKKVVAGLFLDVKSAYPSVIRHRLIHILRTKNYPPYIIAQVNAFLSNRRTTVRLGDFESPPYEVPDGLPQGSPLSVSLFLIYNSDLVDLCPLTLSSDSLSLAFVDDSSFFTAAHDQQQAIENLETLGARALEWGKTQGAIFDKAKSCFMVFSRRRTPTHPLSMKLGNTLINTSPSVKWLGLILDSKLYFAEHVKKMRKIGTATLSQLHQISKTFHGLRGTEIWKLVRMVLVPRILLGSIVWFTKRNHQSVAKIFDVLTNGARRLIGGFLRLTPSTSLQESQVFPPIKTLALRSHHKYIIRKLFQNSPTPLVTILKTVCLGNDPKNTSPLAKIEGLITISEAVQKGMESLSHSSPDPWTNISASSLFLGCSKKDAKTEFLNLLQKSPNELFIYSDGSAIKNSGTAAAAFISDDSFLQLYLDSQSSITAILDPLYSSSGQYLVRHIQSQLLQASQAFDIVLAWCPGHCNITGNEKADELARTSALNKLSTGAPPILVVPNSTLISSKVLKTSPISPVFKNSKDKLLFKQLMSLEKGHAAITRQLQCGYAPLNARLFKAHCVTSPRCPHCGSKETITHFLLHCPKYRKQRRTFRKNLKNDKVKTDWFNTKTIINSSAALPHLIKFLLRSERFPHLRQYQPEVKDS